MTTQVLVVDDSPTARCVLRRALEKDATVRVVGEAADRKAAMSLVETLKPDLVTMDVFLRHEDGIEVTAALMTRSPLPILIVTSRDPSDPQLVYQAMEAGALDVFGKLPGENTPQYEPQRQRLVRLVKALSHVPVVRRRRVVKAQAPSVELVHPAAPMRVSAPCKAILLGSSTGGPPLLAEILRQLPSPASLPVVIVQHMALGFGEGFAAWLGSVTNHRICIVGGPQALLPGSIYLAPVGRHLVFSSETTLNLCDDPPRLYQKPSVDILFESAARVLERAVVAALLTGMGRDGADGLLALHRVGAYTMVQEPSTCIVAGMPEAALSLGAVDVVLSPPDLAKRLLSLLTPV